jgi:hypothetical protein
MTDPMTPTTPQYPDLVLQWVDEISLHGPDGTKIVGKGIRAATIINGRECCTILKLSPKLIEDHSRDEIERLVRPDLDRTLAEKARGG